MAEGALDVLATGNEASVKGLVRAMALDFPNQPALTICFALTSAAAHLEDVVEGSQSVTSLAYRLAALLAADILAIEQLGQRPAQTQHLLHFWRRVDPYFLNI